LTPPDNRGAIPWDELSVFLSKHANQTVTLDVAASPADAGSSVQHVTVPADGFHFGDKVVGTTDDAPGLEPYDPFTVKPLPPDPFDQSGGNADPFVFTKRLKNLLGKPLVIQVRRADQADGAPPVSLLVPPAYTPTTGIIMGMGKVAATRLNSSAAKVGVQEGDTIIRAEMLVQMSDKTVQARRLAAPAVGALAAQVLNPFPIADFNEPDPARLPFDLQQAARQVPGKKLVRLTVLRSTEGTPAVAGGDDHRANKSQVLDPAPWDESWDYDVELPVKASDPLAIPQLGLAYYIECTVKAVAPDSPAAKAGIVPGDRISAIRRRNAGPKIGDEKKTWSNWIKLETKRANGRAEYDEWAFCTQMLRGYYDCPTLQLKVARDGAVVQDGDGKDKEFELEMRYDTTWPSDQLGLNFQPDTTIVKATSVLDAIGLGLNETWDLVQRIYLGMRNLVTNRADPVNSFGGPIAIATTAFGAAEDPVTFILFMGMISINLAIVNFLPIPVLDGGHMVFLVYEKIRGKPPSDSWKIVLTYIGLGLLLALMVAAFGVDIYKLL
jgi:regulator of sigma E protease